MAQLLTLEAHLPIILPLFLRLLLVSQTASHTDLQVPFSNLLKCISHIDFFLHTPTWSNISGISGFHHNTSSPVTHSSFQDALKYPWSLFSQPSTDTRTSVSRSQAVTCPSAAFSVLVSGASGALCSRPKHGCQLPVPLLAYLLIIFKAPPTLYF